MKNQLILFLLLTSFITRTAIAQSGADPCTAVNVTFDPNPCDTVNAFILPPVMPADNINFPNNGCMNYPIQNNIWVKFTVPNYPSAGVRFKMYSSSDTLGYELYSSSTNDCSNIIYENCFINKQPDRPITDRNKQDGRLAFYSNEVVVGKTYWLRLWETQAQTTGMVFKTGIIPLNDDCVNVYALEGKSCNYGAFDNNEPDVWTPINAGTNGCVQCNGCNTQWGANDNAVWYNFTVDATTPQPITLSISNVVCYDGIPSLQMAIYTNNNTCDLSQEQIVGCAVGTGVVSITDITLPLGSYYLFLDGSAGAQCQWEFTSEQLLSNLAKNNPVCPGQALILTAKNKRKPNYTYTYLFGGGNLGVLASDTARVRIVSNPVAGTYYVTVTETTANGSTKTTVATVDFDFAPVPTPTALPALSLRCGNGCGPIDVGNGLGTYNAFRWSNGDSTQIARACTQGLYTVTVTNGYGCTATGTTVVDSLLNMYVTSGMRNFANCEGNDGRITVNSVTGGAQRGLQYWLDNNDFAAQSNTLFQNVTAGVHIVWARDTIGCLCSDTINIPRADTVLPKINLQLNSLYGNCDGNNGQINIISAVGGAQGGFTYWLDNNSSQSQSTPNFMGVSSGPHVVWVQDSLRCRNSDTIIVAKADTILPKIKLQLNSLYGNCEGNNGKINIISAVGGAQGGFTYWLDNNSLQAQSSPNFVGVSSGSHVVWVQDSLRCRNSDTIIVAKADTILPKVKIKARTLTADCDGKNGTIIIDKATGGAGAPYTFTFNNIAIANNNNLTFNGLNTGAYIVTALDSLRCKDTAQVVVPQLYYPELVYTARAPLIFVGETAQLIPIVTRGYIIRWDWEVSSYPQSCLRCKEPFVTPDVTTTYTVTVTDDNTCIVTRSVTVQVKSKLPVYAPNVISANDDGTNDVFTLYAGKSLSNIRLLQVFDRWGELIFEGKNLRPNIDKDGWDGTFKGKPALAGVYVWRAELDYSDGQTGALQGDITVVR